MTGTEFKSWLVHHREVCDRGDWPQEPTFYLPWKGRLDKLKCDLATACEASSRVAETPPKFLGDHLNAVADAVVGIYRARQSRSASPAVLVERAIRGDELNHGEINELAALCRGCLSCEGNGIAVRHGMHNPGKTLSLHCKCSYGRWIRERCRKTAPDVTRRVLDLVENQWLDGEEYGGPGQPDPEGFGPVEHDRPRREYAHAGPEPAF